MRTRAGAAAAPARLLLALTAPGLAVVGREASDGSVSPELEELIRSATAPISS